MTYTGTYTSTFTITEARYVASKLGADLRNLNARYGHPATDKIPDFIEEAAQYLKAGYLDYVDFGFKNTSDWKLRLRYTAVCGQLRDDVPGSLPSGTQVAGYEFHSFLRTNATFGALTTEERAAFERSLPVSRTPGVEPEAWRGSLGTTTQYSRSGHGLTRDVYTDL